MKNANEPVVSFYQKNIHRLINALTFCLTFCFLQKIAKLRIGYDAAEEDDTAAMLDFKLEENYTCEPTTIEKATAQLNSKVIFSTYADFSGSAGRMSYFIVDDFCSIHGKHHNWDKF